MRIQIMAKEAFVDTVSTYVQPIIIHYYGVRSNELKAKIRSYLPEGKIANFTELVNLLDGRISTRNMARLASYYADGKYDFFLY